jgi:SNF2 family DNA or RNA helicase
MRVTKDAVDVRGSMSPDDKEAKLDAFTRGDIRTLVTKPRVAGFGLNWQHCRTPIFAGLSFSYEQYYQALRRFYRFGQKRDVTAHIVMSDTEAAIWSTVSRKMKDHETMKQEMTDAMSREVLRKGVKHFNLGDQKAKMPVWM